MATVPMVPRGKWGSLVSRAQAPSPYAIDTLTFDDPTFDAKGAFAAGMTGAVMDLRGFPRQQTLAREELKKWNDAAVAAGAGFRIVRRTADFKAAKDAGQFAVVLNSQDAGILEAAGDSETKRFETLKEFHELGLRVLQLTYNDRNTIGGGYWEDTEVPLSLYGRRLVERMNELGVLIDLSHVGELTTLDAIKRSTKPVAVTHSGARALYDNQRNKRDVVIRALADRGGYFGVYNMTLWMTKAPTSSVVTIADHIDYVVKIGGIDLVGFGSDHPPHGEKESSAQWAEILTKWGNTNRALGRRIGEPPNGHGYASDLNAADRLQRLAEELRRRRYKNADVDKVLGLNFIRVMETVIG